MKKFIKKVKEVFVAEKVDENVIKVNGMLKICFENRESLDAIITFKKFEQAFENELKNRNMNALEINADCESFFRRKYKEQLELK